MRLRTGSILSFSVCRRGAAAHLREQNHRADEKVRVIVNLKTGKPDRMTIPPNLLARADKVIK